jgi:type II secretory ATPase GspE/PulE/Tfp pilus assembly ATPase PilB-like protein
MKVEPFLIASTVNIAIGQRLVRKICPDCKTKKEISADELKSLANVIPKEDLGNQRVFYYGKGCGSCDDSGYRGRIGIYEILEVDDAVRTALMKGADASEIKRIAIEHGMTTMVQDGFKKAVAGVTTLQEILRVIHE